MGLSWVTVIWGADYLCICKHLYRHARHLELYSMCCVRDDFEMPGNDTLGNVIRNEINENILKDCGMMREYGMDRSRRINMLQV